jgi:SAM-dependent methyltransferase
MKTEYTESQYSSNYPDGVENHWWNLVRNRFIHRILRAIDPPMSAVIEIGCGRGVVVGYLRKNGVNCSGVELAAVQPMHDAAGHVRTGISAFDLPAAERASYEVVLLLDVLEHLPDPREFLGRVLEHYPNARQLVITVPARPELWSNYDQHYGHFLRYTTKQLEQMMLGLCLRPKSIGYFFHALYLPAWLLAKSKKDRETDIIAPQGWRRLAHRFVSYLLVIDAVLLPSGLPGSSAYAVCDIDRAPA